MSSSRGFREMAHFRFLPLLFSRRTVIGAQAQLNLLSFEVDLWGQFAPRNRSGTRKSFKRGRKSEGRRYYACQ